MSEILSFESNIHENFLFSVIPSLASERKFDFCSLNFNSHECGKISFSFRIIQIFLTLIKRVRYELSPSLQNFLELCGSERKLNFCRSAYVSIRSPNTNIVVPVVSKGVIVFGASGWEWRGELMMITGSETTNTQTA